MSADSVRILLNLPVDVRQPHAYQVLGLADGEQNADTIQQAIQATIQKLREARAATNPDVWSQAAQLVQQARGILGDPQKKADLDARFGIISISAEDEFGDDGFGDESFEDDGFTAPQPATADPLAGLLPNANPLAPVAAPSAPESPQFNLSTQPAASSPATVSVATDSAPTFAPPKLKTSTPKLRRKRSSLPMLLFGFVIIGMTFTAMAMAYYLVWGPGQIAINTSGNGIQISSGAAGSEETSQVSPPTGSPAVERKRERDPIMGSLGPELPGDTDQYVAPMEPDNASEMAMNDAAPAMDAPMQAMTPDSMTPDSMTPDNMTPDAMPTPEAATPDPEMMPVQETMPMPEAVPPDPQMVEAAAAAIEQAKAAIKKADWANMASLAEKAGAAAVTDEQRQAADSMFQLADLATFYRGGIERALKDLTIGNTFEVTEGLEIVIVDVTAEKLTIRSAAKNRSYSVNELPLALAHKLASFHVDPDATGTAAKAAYQAITPVSTEPYREESIMWLGEINDEIAGAERDKLIAAIRMVYEN